LGDLLICVSTESIDIDPSGLAPRNLKIEKLKINVITWSSRMLTRMSAKLPDEIVQMIYKQVMEETLTYFIPVHYVDSQYNYQSNGLEDGIYREYENGKLKKVLQYKNGKMHGTCTYYEKNRICEISQWKNGKRDGVCSRRYFRWKKYFYEKGERVGTSKRGIHEDK